MDKYGPKFGKALLTPDTHYMPGYTGYCPQLKYTMGKTYSQLTGELLTRPKVKHGGGILGIGHVTNPAVTRRSYSDSDLKTMIPGYTGFVPKRQNYYACSYAETCRKALSDFYQEQHSKSQRRYSDLPGLTHTDQQFETPNPYKPLKSVTPPGKPYSMDDDDPLKYFISGFTGHVPKSRFLIGKGYPITTNKALIQFRKAQQCDPSPQDRKDSTVTHMPTIYPLKGRMVPSFTGHIPGYKFMYGHTFGQLSQNALEKSVSKRILPEKS